jgi:hypothetical protein
MSFSGLDEFLSTTGFARFTGIEAIHPAQLLMGA